MNWRLTRADSSKQNKRGNGLENRLENPLENVLETRALALEASKEHRAEHGSYRTHRFRRSFGAILAVFSSLIFSGLAFAQNALSRDDAIKAAENTPGVLAARARLSAAEAQIAAAQLPVSGSVTGGYTFAGANPAPPPGTELGGWNLSTNLTFAGLRGEANDARVNALLNLERSKRGLVAARLKAQKTAVNLWHSLRRAESGLSFARRSLEFSELQDRAADTRFKAGAISVSDREAAVNALESARLDALRAESRLETARAQLIVNLSLSVDRTAGEWKPLAAPNGDGNLDAREDVFEARAAVVTAEIELDRVWRGILPSANLNGAVSGAAGTVQAGINTNLTVNAGYTYPNTSSSTVLSNTGTSWSVSVSATIPISPAQWGQVAPSEQNLSAALAALEATLRSARADVQARRAAVPLATRALELAQKTLESARANLERAKTRAANGVIAPIDVTRAELEVIRAQDGVQNAQAELDSTVLDVLEALATPLG